MRTTAATSTPGPGPGPDTDGRPVGVHDVAAALAATTDPRAAARAVRRLERAACAPLGGTDGEPLVVLQRRGARALGRLAGGGATAVLGAVLAGLLDHRGTGEVHGTPSAGPADAVTGSRAA